MTTRIPHPNEFATLTSSPTGERPMNKAKELLMNRQLAEMPQMSERMLNGHYVEKYIDGYWVDRAGPFQFRNALECIMSDVTENNPDWSYPVKG
jgi:hypothetical protein